MDESPVLLRNNTTNTDCSENIFVVRIFFLIQLTLHFIVKVHYEQSSNRPPKWRYKEGRKIDCR
ncbi:MAG TPA: hypothetical protein PLO39_05080, partial [Saprospiraceae bacterium]|nr:hypothetical protein [Saprospiraceae bacterium]